MIKAHLNHTWLILLLVSVILAQCSPRTGRSILTFFLDGVPGADSTFGVGPVSMEAIPRSADFSANAVPDSSKLVFIHVPYREKACSACHDERSLGNMVEPEPDLCYLCHEDLGTLYAYLHGPAAGGYCTACHHPHLSGKEKLLRYTGNELCYWCHERGSVLKNEIHLDLEATACTDCHNPHGGEDRFILR